eukprot:3497534-Heterocapsa_arctica.AAC.1
MELEEKAPDYEYEIIQDKMKFEASSQEGLEEQGNSPNNTCVRKDLATYNDSQADKRNGKVPSISILNGEVKEAGQLQTKVSFMSAGGAALRGQYEWAPD